MLKLTQILGQASDPELAGRLHDLGHAEAVEYIVLDGEDTLRHRLHVTTDRGTECAIVLPRHERLADGAVMMLEPHRAIVVRLREERWLTLEPRDAAAALELGYFAGNMHWPVRFAGSALRIALHGPVESYRERLAPLLADRRVKERRDD